MRNFKYCSINIILISFLHYATSECWFQVDYDGNICDTIEDVPEDANKSWKKLNVQSVPCLKKNAFVKAYNLQYLECHDVGKIEEGAFNGLHRLENLTLYNVTEIPIPMKAFDYLPIENLIITESDIKTIQTGFFNKMPQLKNVELSRNKIEEVQKGVYDNTNIEVLVLKSNTIDKIACKAFENMTKLTELWFQHNLLSEFNSELYFGTSNSLKKLYLTNNTFTKVKKDMFTSTPNLRHLYLVNNQIETIEQGSFGNLPKIEIMSFLTNNMKEVPKGIFDGTIVGQLYLGDNKIEHIAEMAFENMTELFRFSLAGNLLTKFNSTCYFGTSDSLVVLYLTNNSLTEINTYSFSAFPNLADLYLELNNISYIEFGSFDALKKLQAIDISNNRVSSLDPRIFPQSGMQHLNLLTVHNNHLTFINKLLFFRLPKLEYITYAGNPFQCPCHAQLTKAVVKRNITRICDQDYLEGERPVCVFSSLEKEDCLYDESLTDELYEVFNEAVQGYPKLELRCAVFEGFKNAGLKFFR